MGWENVLGSVLNAGVEVNRQREASRVARRTGDPSAWTETAHREDRGPGLPATVGSIGAWAAVGLVSLVGLAMVFAAGRPS